MGPHHVDTADGNGDLSHLGLRAMTWRRIGEGFLLLWTGRASGKGAKGDITPFQALMTELSATVGTGKIAGVATAIYLEGPRAVLWMWVTALFGMATKYGEALLAVKYREIDELGNYVGGPMYYIKNGLGSDWNWLAIAFSLFGMVAAFGIGNTVQANTIASALKSAGGITTWISGLVAALLTDAVIIGGIRRLAEVAAQLVPMMALVYIGGALIIILINYQKVPSALAIIVGEAFTGTAAAGGFAGSTVLMAIRVGVARGLFSNEAGLGSGPIAHAAAQTTDPVRQGMIAMIGVFIDTMIVCTMTALVIVITGAWTTGETGAALSSEAFYSELAGAGRMVVTFGLIVFAYTTLLGWSYYGERCAEFLFGIRVIKPYRLAWIAAILIGAVSNLEFVWLVADILNGLMAVSNLLALIALSPIIFQVTPQYSWSGGEKARKLQAVNIRNIPAEKAKRGNTLLSIHLTGSRLRRKFCSLAVQRSSKCGRR